MTKRNLPLLLVVITFYQTAIAQVPYDWPQAKVQSVVTLNGMLTAIAAKWNGQPSCTGFGGEVFLANSNQGYKLFTANPPSAPQPAYEANLLLKVDTMITEYQLLGYNTLDITISFPLLVDGFPHKSDYLYFYEQVYNIARQHGMKIIENCQGTLADSIYGETYMVDDILNFYYNSGTVFNSQLYRIDKLQMMQTIIDSLGPDYLTIEEEPSTQQVNYFGLVDFSPDSVTAYLTYFMSNLVKGNTLYGAGAGNWDTLAYIAKYGPTAVDYIDYHVYPINLGLLNSKVFRIDSIAMEYNKKIIIGEAWCHKETDSEYVALGNSLTGSELNNARDVYNYWEPVDTLFFRTMINLSQQANIQFVNFFNSLTMFGQLTYDSTFGALSLAQQANVGSAYEYQNMFRNNIGPEGLYIQNAIAQLGITLTPSVTIQSNVGDTAITGSIVTFTAAPVNGGAVPIYQWQKNGNIVGGDSATYTDSTLVTGDVIICILTSGYGCAYPNTVSSDSIVMTVNPNTTGINELPAGYQASLFPNPTQGFITLSLSDDMTRDVYITDALGRVVVPSAKVNRQKQFDLSEMVDGLYILYIYQDQQVKVMKFNVVR